MTVSQVGVFEKIDSQFARALALLAHSPLSSEHVHDLRTTCKRLRGLLRLYRKTDKKRIRAMADAIRQVASALSPTRDRDVLQAQLAHWFKARKHAPVRERLRESLETRDADQPRVRVAELRRKMQKIRQEWLALPDALLAANIDEALFQSRLKAEKAGKKALKTLAPDDLHEWRKRVKDQYYQWDAIAATPVQLRQRAQLKRLGTLLGDVHDLDVFVEFLARDKNGAESDEVLQRIHRQRERLLLRVEALAPTLPVDMRR